MSKTIGNVLEMLEHENVVSFTVSEDKTTIAVTEECDMWFTEHLDKHEMDRMIGQLQELRDGMVYTSEPTVS